MSASQCVSAPPGAPTAVIERLLTPAGTVYVCSPPVYENSILWADADSAATAAATTTTASRNHQPILLITRPLPGPFVPRSARQPVLNPAQHMPSLCDTQGSSGHRSFAPPPPQGSQRTGRTEGFPLDR